MHPNQPDQELIAKELKRLDELKQKFIKFVNCEIPIAAEEACLEFLKNPDCMNDVAILTVLLTMVAPADPKDNKRSQASEMIDFLAAYAVSVKVMIQKYEEMCETMSQIHEVFSSCAETKTTEEA